MDEESTRRRELILTTHSIHMTQTSIPSAGFHPAMKIMDIKYCYFLHICTFSLCGRGYRNKRPLVYMAQTNKQTNKQTKRPRYMSSKHKGEVQTEHYSYSTPALERGM